MVYELEATTDARKAAVKPRVRQKLFRVETCRFKRTSESKWERGLLLNKGDLGIIDVYGVFVPALFKWERVSKMVWVTSWFEDTVGGVEVM